MKRGDLIRHLRRHGCLFLREGGAHSVWVNPETKETDFMPRHTEIDNQTARSICRNLSIPIIGQESR